MSFTVLAIFKNESHILNEWITHYLNEGADHIILGDNNSNDSWQTSIEPRFVGDSRIRFVEVPGEEQQDNFYNAYIKDVTTEWTLIVDLDEFIYSRNEYKTTKDYLDSVPDTVSLVCVPWKLFGSLNPDGSFIEKQPPSVINGFLCHKCYDEIGEFKQVNGMEVKSFVRTIKATTVHIHTASRTDGDAIRPNGRIINGDPHLTGSTIEFTQDNLACNHYITQSLDWFDNVKSKRGLADISGVYRDQKYFDGHGLGTTVCTELRDKTYD